ncbi:hypothetical protein G4Z16_00185 [Streptomyces bathyalis]|uniref:Uncharacterized protein n=1 Tax=Streptomyces bathyalis TaxID=2710756 RepID=A0A7T1WQM1_9ACTN|nr:hypothetical protein [Streptomyces bathyalis]QPP05067.1 hypothetical protein G4Z16_00185 [Streptomyces bathyalis]
MRTEKRVRTSEEAATAVQEDAAAERAYEEDSFDIFRVTCPDCGQPIALLAEEERLPEHALCASPWNPFGLTVCQGSGRAASEAASRDGEAVHEHGLTALLTLPQGLDWRMQPFSHASGPRTPSLLGEA